MKICCAAALLLIVSGSSSAQIEETANYLGCFSVGFATTSNYSSTLSPISWKICAHSCASKMTLYAGIQARKQQCFCGNDIAMYSEKVSNISCEICNEESGRYCGGEEALSLYKLTKTEPQAFLLATEEGIKFLVDGELSTTYLQSLTQNASAVAYHYVKQVIYFVSEKKIFISYFLPSLMEYNPPREYIRGGDISGLDVDYVNSYFHWSNLKRCYDGRGIVIDPYYSTLFRICEKKLERFIVDKLEYKQKTILKIYNLLDVKKVSADVQQKTLYLIGSFANNDTNLLLSTSYNGSQEKLLYDGPELSNVFSLDAYNNRVVWVNYNDSKYRVYSATVTPRGHIVNITIHYQGTQKINQIKFFKLEAQRPSVEYACEKKGCSHHCHPMSLTVLRCTCPVEMALDEDGKTCVDKYISTSTDTSPDFSEETTMSTEELPSTRHNPNSWIIVASLVTNFMLLLLVICSVIYQYYTHRRVPSTSRNFHIDSRECIKCISLYESSTNQSLSYFKNVSERSNVNVK